MQTFREHLKKLSPEQLSAVESEARKRLEEMDRVERAEKILDFPDKRKADEMLEM